MIFSTSREQAEVIKSHIESRTLPYNMGITLEL